MKRIRRFSKRTWVLVGVVAVVAAMASVGAYAYWTASGTGSGSATVGTDAGVTIDNVLFSGALYPDGSVDVTFDVTNNSSNTAVKVGDIVADASQGTNGISDMSDAGCDEAWFTYSGTTLDTEIAAGDTLNVTVGGGTLDMSNELSTNQDACKNATFTLNLVTDNSGI